MTHEEFNAKLKVRVTETLVRHNVQPTETLVTALVLLILDECLSTVERIQK